MHDRRDAECMSLALRLARHGRYSARPNPSVGCVITNALGDVVGRGWHEYAGQAHAEINALQEAGEGAVNGTAYVTLEPCCHEGKTGPCSRALIKAGIKRAVVAMQDPNPLVAGRGIKELLAHGIETQVGLMQAQAGRLNRGFIKRVSQGLPWVTVKMAVSLDGRSALSNGQSKWISCRHARQDVQYLRARHSAVMTGVRTVIADNPALNIRLTPRQLGLSGKLVQPVRVVVDCALKTPVSAKMLLLDGPTWIFTAKTDGSKKFAHLKNCKIFTLTADNGRFVLKSLMRKLAGLEINNVLIEAGPGLVGQLLEEKLVDEWISYIAPKFMGDDASGMLTIKPLVDMDDCVCLRYSDVRQIGNDLRITARVSY